MWKCSMCGQNNTDTQNACGICGTFKPASASSNSTGGYTMAIRCFVPGCMEGVTGQCAGLENEPCGHFYCSKHSRGKLCGECVAVQKTRNLTQKYIEAAEWVSAPLGCGSAILYAIFAVPVGFFCAVNEQWILAAFFILMSIFCIIILIITREKHRLNEKCAELRNFEEFYRKYKKQKSKEQLSSFLAVSLAIMLSPEDSTASDIRRIRKRLE